MCHEYAVAFNWVLRLTGNSVLSKSELVIENFEYLQAYYFYTKYGKFVFYNREYMRVYNRICDRHYAPVVRRNINNCTSQW